jgi:hypothetical protein
MLKSLFVALVAVSSVGCAAFRDPRDAAWDPDQRQARYLHEQIPNWEHEAARRCAGGRRQIGPGQTDRC